MADTVSDKDVEKARSRVDRLREQIAEENTKASSAVRANENTVRKARLDSEATRLEAQLAALKESNKAANVKAATQGIIEQVAVGQADVVATSAPIEEEK